MIELQVKAFLAHLETQPGYTRSTRSAYASDLRVFLDYLQGTLGRPGQAGDLDAGRVAAFLQAEKRAGRSRSTQMRRLAVLRQFARFLDVGQLPAWRDFPADSSPAQNAFTSQASPPFLTEGQVETLLAAIQAAGGPRALRDRALFMLILECGLPTANLATLDLTDIDLRLSKLHCVAPHGIDAWLSLGAAAGPLERYIRDGRPDLNHQPAEPALFISQIDGRLSRQGIWQVLKGWGQAVSPPIDLSPRLVRNTAALRMAQAGRPAAEIQTLLGHSNPFSTQALLRRLRAAGPRQRQMLLR